MKIEDNKVVSLTYKLSNHKTGEIIEETTTENPMVFLYGVGSMIPEFEASIEIIRQSLMILDVPLTKIINFTDEIRHQNYSSFRIDKIKNTISDNIKNTPFLLEMTWFEVARNSAISGKSIKELSIRSKTGVSIVGLLRNNEFIPNPDPGFIFETGDRIAIIGLPENKKIFNDLMMSL